MIDNGEDSGEDVFQADYNGGRRGGKDAYEESDDDVVMQHTRKQGKPQKKAIPVKPPHVDEDDDVQMLEVPMKDIPQYKEPKPRKTTSGTKGRKRKSAEVDGDEDVFLDDDDAPASKKSRASNTKSPTKKATPKKRKDDESHQKTAVDDILESITTVRAPTPPPRDPEKKFDWKANAGRTQATSYGGSPELPVGATNCLAGLTFVFTGVLETLQRETGQELVKRYGGKVTGAPSKKTSFVVLGNDAGPKKLETIKQFTLRTIDEQGLFELIRKLPANGGDGKAGEEYEAKARKEAEKVEKEAKAMEEQEIAVAKEKRAREEAKLAATTRTGIQLTSSATTAGRNGGPAKDNRLWTVKYAPTATSMICGNKTQVDKLQAWLRNWPQSVARKFKMPGKEGFGAFRAMCLHGPPGIGKTTAAHLAANLEGYDIVESNASDTRSKKLVETGLKGVLDTTSLLGYFAGDGQKVDSAKKKLVLIMDEVDGMSAGDRGGVGALASVCRKTTVPIILICNDRKQPKMKPFDSVAFDLPFRRPTTDQIRSRIMTICYREGMKIPTQVINALIEGSRADIRQVINMLSTAKLDLDAAGMDFDQGKKMSEAWQKNIILKPWDIVSKILGGGMFASSSTSTLNDKIELYFNDHEFSSLMLQENYLGTSPMLANQYSGKERTLKQLELVDRAAESISDGDLVDRMIHGSQQQWSLMPTHAVFSFVRPAGFVSGSMAGTQTRFTSWLGNNSRLGISTANFISIISRILLTSFLPLGKLSRFVKEIQGHMRLHSSGDRHEIRQQYLPLLWSRLVRELNLYGKDAVDDIIALMDSYYLTKDDWDAILELGVGDMDMEKIKIDSQAKSAFTKLYNQMSHPLPYMKASQVVAPKKKGKDRPDLEEALDESDSGADTGDDEAVLDEDEPLDLKKDKYVKAPKKKPATKPASAKGKGGTKGKGKIKDEDDDMDVDEEEDVKPPKGKGKANSGKGRAKK